MDELRVDKNLEFFSLPVLEAIKKADDAIFDYVSYKWGGIKYRKKQDARWGFFFSKLDIPFRYIEKPMKIVGEIELMPDFWLQEQDCFIIVSPDFLQNDAGKLMAYCFAKEKRKVIFQLWNCKPGFEFGEDCGPIINRNWGYYLTPEGEFGDGMEFGVCEKCDSVHVGHLGFPDLGDREYRRTSNNNCSCYMGEVTEELLEAYEKVRRIFGTYG